MSGCIGTTKAGKFAQVRRIPQMELPLAYIAGGVVDDSAMEATISA
jgi:hypothetical protein